MTLIGVFWTTQDESRPLQHSDASRHEPASDCFNIDTNTKHQMMRFTFDFTLMLTETFIIDTFYVSSFYGDPNNWENRYFISFLRRKSSFSLSNFQFLLCLFSHLNTFCLSSQSHSLEWLLYSHLIFSQFHAASLCCRCFCVLQH